MSPNGHKNPFISVTMYQKRITNWMRCPPWSNYKDVGGSPVGSYEFRGWGKLGGKQFPKIGGRRGENGLPQQKWRYHTSGKLCALRTIFLVLCWAKRLCHVLTRELKTWAPVLVLPPRSMWALTNHTFFKLDFIKLSKNYQVPDTLAS